MKIKSIIVLLFATFAIFLTHAFGNESLLHGKWRIESVEVIDNDKKSWEATRGVDFILEFLADGTIKEEGSCNRLGGSYKLLNDSKISIKFGGTKRGCPGAEPDHWLLGSAHSYKVDKRQLVIYFAGKYDEGKILLSRF